MKSMNINEELHRQVVKGIQKGYIFYKILCADRSFFDL